MSYGKSLTAFEVEDGCGRTVDVSIDDGDVDEQLIAVLVERHGGDERTWAIAVGDGLITPDSLDAEDSRLLDDYCGECARYKLYE